jgi:hypothetical protein
MILFLQHAWFLWWALAVVVILRWFHVMSAGSGQVDTPAPAGYDSRDHSDIVSGQLAFRS